MKVLSALRAGFFRPEWGEEKSTRELAGLSRNWDISPMKLILFSFLFSAFAWAKPTVLVSYFDPFGRAKVNNSETVAKLLLEKTKGMDLPFTLRTCELQTKFDVSVEELRDCIATLPEEPLMVLSLGETGCELKIELMGRNLDRTRGADNAGVERRNTPIVPGGVPAIGFTYPLADMYCALPDTSRKSVIISNFAGTFVCNNLAYQMGLEKNLNFGFVHVPDHSCRNLDTKNGKIVDSLLTMINRGVEVSLERSALRRLPVLKTELEAARREFSGDSCLTEFYKAARPFDEKAWWEVFNPSLRMN